MRVKQLREMLASFDDDAEVCVAPQVSALRVGENRTCIVPHPIYQYEIKGLHVIGDVNVQTSEIGERYVVLAYDDPNVATTFENQDVASPSVNHV